MWVIVLIMLGQQAFSASTVLVQFPLSVYGKPDFESPILFTVEPGTSITVSDKLYGGFKKIKATVFDQTRTGYAAASDLSSQKQPRKTSSWGTGGGLLFTHYSQAARTFSTADDVNYRISNISGDNFNPGLVYQWGQRHFWRLSAIYRSVDLTGTATTDISGAPSQNIVLSYKMVALEAQIAWNLWADYWYGGVGIEAAKSIGGTARLGNQDLTSGTQIPDYLSGHGFSGVQFRFGDSWSVYAEVRIGAVTNQAPMLNLVEFGSSVLYWP